MMIMYLGMCTMMDLHHSKTSAHLEDGLNQQSSSMPKETVVITITVIEYKPFIIPFLAGAYIANIIAKSCIHCIMQKFV